ncbi:MAG: glycine cleavage system aminomethyltransferase GcvT [Bacteroidetes bacterium]|nr:MAG: glycine cleavage system aminomethyltransferase GcvT [Bacteroidota bacterium]
MKELALNDIHIKAGGQMVEFAGFSMAVQYSGLNDEHLTVRNGVGVFDVSHMGEFFVKGPKALELIQYITSNDASKLVDGKIQYSCFPNFNGGIVDDLLVYRISEEEYMLVVNGANLEKDWAWVNKNNKVEADLENHSDKLSLLAVQGPKAADALQSLTDINLHEMKYYTFEIGTFAGVDTVLVSATGYTGSGGFEIYFKNEDAETIWNAIFEAGKSQDIKPCGLGARDTLRLEKGFCLYGNDINDDTSPIEAGLGWITKFNKDFINAKQLSQQKEEGVKKKLVAFEMIDRGIPRHDYLIVNEDGEEIGIVTSGTQSPMLSKGIGMGYVPIDLAKPDSIIYIQVRKKNLKAKVVKLPFV